MNYQICVSKQEDKFVARIDVEASPDFRKIYNPYK